MTQIHFVHAIRENAKKYANQTALRYAEAGQWVDLSWQDFLVQINQLSYALLARSLHIQDKIAIFSQNMPRWTIADIAAQQIRAVAVPIYATSTAKQVAYIVNDADVKILFVGSQAELDIAKEAQVDCPNLEAIVAMTDCDLAGMHNAYSWADFVNVQPDETALQTRLNGLDFSDLFTLIYTSGTTGEPKGVMLDQANLSHQLAAHDIALLPIDHRDVSLSFLPLSHIFERAWTSYVLYRGAVNCYLDDPHKIRETLTRVRPTLMCAVPRFYEKIYSAIFAKVHHAPKLRQAIFAFAVKVAEKAQPYLAQNQPLPLPLKMAYSLAEKLVLTKLRALLGGRIRMMPCGGAKLEPSIGQFFRNIGINIKLGYGMTETTATVSCWDDGVFESTSIGKVMPNTEVKIGAENEILVKGGGVMRGYYKKPQETQEAFTADGFLKTGDVGQIDELGNLYITDRLKELMKTSNGKYIAPQVLESKIGKDYFVEQIAIIADTKKYVSALIVPSFEALEEYAKKLNIHYQDHLELIKHSKIVELFEQRIEELQKELPSFEQIKKFTLLPQAFSMKMEEITPTLKLRRKVILERYHHLIEAMYK